MEKLNPEKLNQFVCRIDRMPLWCVGILLLAVIFAPYLILGEGSVFPVHDQLDETIMTYVLNARHFPVGGDTVFHELLGGIRASGMQPSAVLFILLYRLLPVSAAFVVQYLIVSIAGFFGMYGSVKEITGSGILALAAAGCFVLLPIQPVYGLSVSGVPLLLYCFLCLYQRKHVAGSFGGILFFGLTTHLVLIGYVALGFWLLAILVMLVKKRHNRWVYLGFLWLTGIYIGVNHSLFSELLLGKGSYVSHREELVNYALPFWETVKGVFLESAQHAPSLHGRLILPIFLLLVLGLVCCRNWEPKRRRRLSAAWAGMAVLAGIAILYGVCHLPFVVDFKNSCSGFLRYFQLERFYWLYPAGWYLEFALCCSVWWSDEACRVEGIVTEDGKPEAARSENRKAAVPEDRKSGAAVPENRKPGAVEPEDRKAGAVVTEERKPEAVEPENRKPEAVVPKDRKAEDAEPEVSCAAGRYQALKLILLVILLLPTMQLIKTESYFYLNVNQINNGSGITGYITWESYYAEELMGQLEEAIGRDPETYRVAHLGMSPAPALMHGFYTADGYSNNYPLEYKHLFRQVIEKELAKNEQTRLYFDQWGSRCYLFNGSTGNAWMLGKTMEIKYEGLEFDLAALGDLGCEYIFSAGEIVDWEEMGLDFLGYYETDTSFWGVWLYGLNESNY